MSHIDNKITLPIDVYDDLGTVLGTGSGDLGANCSAASIKKWAKWHPLRSGEIGILSAAQRAQLNHGLTAPDQRVSIPLCFGDVWTYTPPTGGVNQRFRVRDFVDPDDPTAHGYDHNAQAPAQPMEAITILRAFRSSFNFSAAILRADNPDWISWSSLVAIQNYYLCVVFSKTADFATTNEYIYKTASATIANNGILELNSNDLNDVKDFFDPSDSGYYFLCAASAAKTSFRDPAVSSSFMALPSDSASDMTNTFTLATSATIVTRVPAFSQLASPASDAAFDVPGIGTIIHCDRSYYLHFKCEVTAPTGTNIVIDESSLTVDISHSFVGNINLHGLRPDLYDSTFTHVSSISLNGGQTTTIYLLVNTPILKLDEFGQLVHVQTGQTISSTINFNHRGFYIGNTQILADN